MYQPVDLPARTATRAAGSRSRWAAMRPVVERTGSRTAIDIGANAGYFSIELGRLGIHTIALESEPGQIRMALLAVKRSGVDDVGVMAYKLRPDNLDLLPTVDCTLFLSLWHHLVRWEGMTAATAMLQELWRRTDRVMFFDTGETEMPPSFRLPEMHPDAETWLSTYLADSCQGAQIEHLGRHAAFDAAGRPCERNLFAVVRSG
jgi:hypothetical protein